MACKVLSPSEPHFASHLIWPTLNGELDDTIGNGSSEDSFPFLSAVCFPDGSWNPSYFPQEDFSGGFQSEHHRRDYFYEREELPYGKYGDWPSDHEPCFSSGWERYFFLLRDDDSNDDEQWNGRQKENLYQNEEESHDFYQIGEMQSSDEHDLAAGYGFWPEHIWGEATPETSQQEPTSSFVEPAFYESLFGYWPSLFQEELENFMMIEERASLQREDN
ncbi:hypothetical protein ACJRO7_008749 [Eucalyptus globulus]|uniref:Uncharacterized protein n=1 Tax=Eucalyptus globulus TaxID=34317 RepID=A0ABD3IRW2_EUCGL